MATPFSVKKKAKNGTFARKRMESEAYNFGMQTKLDYANSMGWVPSGHTSSSTCVRLKISKVVLKIYCDLITCLLLFSSLHVFKADTLVTTAH